MNKLKEKLKNSFFIINKVYVFLIFIWLSFVDFTLAIVYFAISILVFVFKTLKAKVPINTNKKFKMITLVYKKTSKLDLKVDIWYPNKNKKTYPLVYFCHGGGWISGFRNQPNNISWCNLLADRGFAVASIDYRYGYKNTMMDILSDYTDGLKFLRDNKDRLGLDMDNISLVGLSAGGHLSLLYSTYFTSIGDRGKAYMEGIRSVVAYYSPTNLNYLLMDDNKSLFSKFAIRQTLKDSPTKFEDVYNFYSPISYLTENMVPVLLAHGEEDKTVPFISSVEFSNKLTTLGVANDFLIHKTADHSFDTSLKDYATINILEQTIRFMKKHLGR